MRRMLSTAIALAACITLATSAFAFIVYETDFEGVSASSDGVILTGQDGFYIPTGTTSVDWYAYTYAGNAIGLPTNPEGGSQFAGGIGPGSPTFARAEHELIITDDLGILIASYDFAATYLGAPPSANNIGSFSLRSTETANDFIHLFSWVDPNNPTSYNAYYLAYDAAGNQFAQPGSEPGPAWSNLELNHWYHAWTTMDLEQNRILEVGIRDIEGGGESVVNPTDWYLEGGSSGSTAPPFAFRMFAGGSVPDNAVAFDNVVVEFAEENGACCFSDGTCQVMNQADCDTQGGYLWIPNEVCDPNPCPPVVVKETTWGRIKNQYQR